MTHKPLDFKKVEELRKYMLIPVGDWVKVLGVSRMTYYKWVNGIAQPRVRRHEAVRATIKLLLAKMAEGWPSPEVAGMEPQHRVSKLLALLKQP